MTTRTELQEWVLGQLVWRPSNEGHDETCWRRHPQCAETYIRNLQVAVATLDGELQRVLDGHDFEALVEAEVLRRLAAGRLEAVKNEREPKLSDAAKRAGKAA